MVYTKPLKYKDGSSHMKFCSGCYTSRRKTKEEIKLGYTYPQLCSIPYLCHSSILSISFSLIASTIFKIIPSILTPFEASSKHNLNDDVLNKS